MLSWITDSNFDIDYHVRHSALPRPGRIRGLLALMPRLHVQRLDPRRPGPRRGIPSCRASAARALWPVQ
ncbi:MAG TPA: hypothetical protein DC022_12570, partial [Alcanivorax sp.]|nr:hypothetical protein [Alcanivorax sp.]